MTVRIPIIAAPNQSLTVNLGGQICKLTILQRGTNVYLSLNANGVDIVTNSMCRDRVSIVRAKYLPFSGNLAFVDTQGHSDPDYSGFGTRYKLAYLP